MHKLQKLLKLRSQNDIELHVEVQKGAKQIKICQNEYKLSDLDRHKKEIIEELKVVEYNDLEDIVFRMELTYHETAEILDQKNVLPHLLLDIN